MYRVLLVDDEILVRDAIRENIDWAGMDCELAGDCENGQEAAEFVKTHPVDIVLTDICMPYMDGMELSHFLHDNYPDVVIVIFSGFGEFEYAKKAIQYNVSEYLLKPITAMELRKVIENMKEKVDQKKKEKEKIESLTKTSKDYQKNAHIIRSRAIAALVNGTADVQSSLKELAGMGIELVGASYRVAVFDMDTYSDLHQLDGEKRQESALMAFVLYNVSDEIVKREQAGIVYQEGNNRVCVLFQGNRTKEFDKKVKDICREVQVKLREVIGIEVSAGIGSWVRNPGELLRSHDLAEQALKYRYLLGRNLLIDMEEIQTEKTVSIQDSLNQLMNSLKSGKRQEMEDALDKMENNIKDAVMEKSRALIYLQQIVRAVGSACMAVVSDTDRILRERGMILEKVAAQNTFRDAMGLIRDFAAKSFGELSEANSSSGQRQASLALDYIYNNYMDADLSLNSICSYLNISTSYFSTIFKEVTGATFIEVLTRTRMEKAMELLENTTLKNYEIAEKVGFSDPHYFGISFKKMTGKTPTEYAREKRK